MALRKSPHADLRRATPLLVQTGIAVTLLVLITAFRADLRGSRPVIEPPLDRDLIHVEDIPQTQHEVQPPPAPRPPAPIEVPNEMPIQEVPIALDDDLPVALPIGPPPAPPQPVMPPSAEEPEPDVFRVVEEQPEMLPNNEEGLRALQQSIVYPEIAKRAGVEGRVTVQFVVDEQGNVRDPFVVRGIGAGCDEEAVRAVSRLRFKPGKQRGKAVKVQMTLPVHFRLR